MSSEPMNEKEYRSSAWALILVGGAGLILVLLGAFGVIPLRPANPYLFYGVMMAVFVLFLVMGTLSFKSARIFAEKAKKDNTLMEAVEAWCKGNLRAEEIDEAAVRYAQETEGIDTAELGSEDGQTLYFIRCEYIKNRINSQFMNLDQMLLDRFVDESLYDLIFGKYTHERN